MIKEDQLTKHGQEEAPPSQKAETHQAHGFEAKMLCTAEEVRALIKKTGDLNISRFPSEFRAKYGRSPYEETGLLSGLTELAAESKLFILKKKKGSFWLSLSSLDARKEKEKPATKESSKKKQVANHIKRLVEENGRIYMGQIEQLYKTESPFVLKVKGFPIRCGS